MNAKTLNADPALMSAAGKLMDWCDQLAQISADPECLSRFYVTPEHRRCNDQVTDWMQAVGLDTWEDTAGNLWGRYTAAPDSPAPVKTLILGSHLDTVPNAGRYDGMLGVLIALVAVEQLAADGVRLPFNVDIVGFGDEEGSRFGTTLLGSGAVAGTWKQSWWSLEDAEGITLAQAFERFGLEPTRISEAARSADELLGYLELHIEQGPVLEQMDQPLGVVTSIAGARRFQIEIDGYAGHAGTVPMALRTDALAGAAELVLAVERVAQENDIVATVGQLQAKPGAVNVIPGGAALSLDIRSGDDRRRDVALEKIQKAADEIVARRSLTQHWQEIHKAPAVACADWLQELQAKVLSDLDLQPVRLMSGAGHDAMAMANVTDCAMYFLRCKGGVSHHPDEAITESDLVPAIAALAMTLVALGEQKR